MLTSFIFLLLLLVIFFQLLNYKKASLFTSLLTILIFLAIGDGPLPNYLVNKLQDPYQQTRFFSWGNANLLILFGAGTCKTKNKTLQPSVIAFSRLTKAVELYRECKKTRNSCSLLISGGDPLKHGESEAKVYQKALISLGVKPSDIQVETESKNTFQNTQFTRYLLIKLKKLNTKIIFIGSGLTLKRVLLYCSHFNIYPTVIASDFFTVPFSKFPLGYNFALCDFALHEYVGIARFFVYTTLGLNP